MNVKYTKTLVIKSSEWGRSAYVHGSELDSIAGLLCNKTNGKMCCLGILARDCGIPVAKLYGIGMPEDIVDQEDPDALGFPDWVFRTVCDTEEDDDGNEYEGEERMVNSPLAEQLAEINDSTNTTDEQKIGLITMLLQNIGWTVDWRPNE